MKLPTALIVISCCIASISAAAILGLDGMNMENTAVDEMIDNAEPSLMRVRRFSCDLFSFQSAWITPGDSVCAAKCMMSGRKGGTCQNNICNCREAWGR